ncbi:monovalent cation/H(+) antiporter subunit G [Pararhizobium antarcticum]|uniref:Cation:proton antiporter n=1 Tax=Pararhizobium antarcticum TaxID=1798805 RepID=A0A657LZF0_9HYPH|nr:monovalent cation/H(+) antiporter subunit G [Pararhizobium antarcticum]OJF96557.1 cation:proton antiporter [Rhizobium sp. 58]OJG01438.1 cation:proton antiporter [Pararhizobium antarcticum]
MSHLTDLPLWAAIPVCLLLLAGSIVTLIGSIGLLRLKSFYSRLHAPTLGASAGVIMICLASMLCFAVLQNRWIFHEVLIIVFIILTTPVTLMLLGQSALYRDRIEEKDGVPRKTTPDLPTPETETP